MTPGLARGPPFPPNATKDAIVAIASLEDSSVPMVVGVCEVDVSALQQVQGSKGHAVRGVHWAGDEIWAWSTSGKPGGNAPVHIDGWDIDDEMPSLDKEMQDLRTEDPEEALDDDQDDGGVALNNPPEQAHNEFVDGEDALPYEKVDVEDKELSTKGIIRFLQLEACVLIKFDQKSTTFSARPFCMVYINIEPRIKKIHTTASNSQYLNHWLSRI